MTTPAPQQDQTATNGRQTIGWYRLSVDEVTRRLGTTPASVLTDAEVRQRLEQYGANEGEEQGALAAGESSSVS